MNKKIHVLTTIFIIAVSGIYTMAYTNKPKSIGSVLSTDIVTYIDRTPIASYDYLDSIYVKVDDLQEYGFQVIWDKALQTVSVTFPEDTHTENFTEEEKAALAIRQTKGEKVFDVYPTDTKIKLNGIMLSDFENGIATAINADNKILISFDVLGEQFGTIDYNDQQRTFSLTTPKDSFTSVETVMDYPKIKLQYKETLPFDTTGYSISKSDTVAADVDLSSEELMFHWDHYVFDIICFSSEGISAAESEIYFLFSPALVDTFHMEVKNSEKNAVTLKTEQELVELTDANVILSFQPTFLYETNLSLYTTDGKQIKDLPFPCFLSIDGNLYISAEALAESLGMTQTMNIYGEGTFEKQD